MERTKKATPPLRRLAEPLALDLQFKKEKPIVLTRTKKKGKLKRKKKPKDKQMYVVRLNGSEHYYGYVAGYRHTPILMDYETASKLHSDLEKTYYSNFTMEPRNKQWNLVINKQYVRN